MSEEKPDYKPIPIGDPYLEEVDPELHAANQAAHRVAKLARGLREALTVARSRKYVGLDTHNAELDLYAALDEYEKLCPEKE